jgi:hypothetical protein
MMSMYLGLIVLVGGVVKAMCDRCCRWFNFGRMLARLCRASMVLYQVLWESTMSWLILAVLVFLELYLCVPLLCVPGVVLY